MYWIRDLGNGKQNKNVTCGRAMTMWRMRFP
jgi:hypothetical protein